MAGYNVYAVRKDEKTGNIKECFVHEGINRAFTSEKEALNYIKYFVTPRDKHSIIFEMSLKLASPSTMLFNVARGRFEEGAKIHIYGDGFLRTDGNDTTRDNLENIMEIP